MDSYWKEVVSTVDNTDTVVLYQGDHGVNIVPDKGNRGEKRISLTHCEFSLNHYKELYNTIGLLYSPNKKYYNGFENLKNGYSAKHMMPTILDFAGYKEIDYKKEYGPSFKSPDKTVPLYILGEKVFKFLGEDNVSNLYQDIEEEIVPLNKRRILENSLKVKEQKI